LVRLKDAIEELKPELRVFRDENSIELFDLPDTPLPPADAPEPPRFVPEYDNLVLAHADRTRVLADEHRSRVFLSTARVRATFLLNGFVGGTWKIERTGGAVTLVIEPFEPLPDEAREALLEEGERLIRFVEDDAEALKVRLSR
jgi:Winged helix DNA-binding domain